MSVTVSAATLNNIEISDGCVQYIWSTRIDVTQPFSTVTNSTQYGTSISIYTGDDTGPFAEYLQTQDGISIEMVTGFNKPGIYTFDIAQSQVSIYAASLYCRDCDQNPAVEVVEMGNRSINGYPFGVSRFSVEIDEACDRYLFTIEGEVIAEETYQNYGCLQLYVFNVQYKTSSTDEIIDNQDKNTQDIIDNQNENTEDIMDNQDKNTQAIIDNQNELQDKEKEEAEGSGNSALQSGTEAFEDKSSGFISAINKLIQPMLTTSTSAYLTIPRIYIPAIPGICSEVTLYEGSSYQLDQVFYELIPYSIIMIIRSILTIALIGYCFYELYALYEYFFVNKGGAGDE